MLDSIVRRSLDGTIPALLVMIAVLAGTIALVLTPREEEPQIVVPSADVLIAAPSLDARQVERLVATPLEKLLSQIDGVEHVYSTSESGRAVVSVSFYVGEDREDSLLKLYSKVYSHQDIVSPQVISWVVRPIEVDDVPVLSAVLWSEDPQISGYELRRLADEAALALQSVPKTNRVDVVGGSAREFQVLVDPMAMTGRLTAIDDVLAALSESNIRQLGGMVDRDQLRLHLEIDNRIYTAAQLADLTVNVVDGVPVRLGDVASIVDGPAEPENYTWLRFADNHPHAADTVFPSVTIAVAKQRGANAVSVTAALVEELHVLAASLFPEGVNFEITRNYGQTANQKIGDLLTSLVTAILVVTVLVGLTLGWRAAAVVALAVPLCYGITLGLGYVAGYTINRVTLFALILALGLLVDDPITGVDNIERHLGASVADSSAIVNAMAEIKVPLLMSTLAIIVVFAPMSFITGMMGPYMSPMAFNVPVSVVVSTVVAFLVTPWLGLKLLKPARPQPQPQPQPQESVDQAGNDLYARLLRPFLTSQSKSIALLVGVGILFVAVAALPLFRLVPLKLLPYDNKNEFQIVIDAAEGSTLETTDGIARELADYLAKVPEVRLLNAYLGTHSPMDFNGLIRRYYLRDKSHQGELHVVLADKLNRPDQSHALILRLRRDIENIAQRSSTSVKLVEIPPGPPVLATLVAEHYGGPTTSYATLIASAQATAARLRREPGVVDVDVSAAADSQILRFVPDQEKAALSGISAASLATALTLFGEGKVAGYVAVADEASPLAIRAKVPYPDRDSFARLSVKGRPGVAKLRTRGAISEAPTPLVSIGELGTVNTILADQPIFHKDLQPVAYAFAEVAGRVPAAVIADVEADRMDANESNGDSSETIATRSLDSRTYLAPGGGDPWSVPDDVIVRWNGEGEWNITLRVFRDLGIAFGVALCGLFALIRLQTGRSALTAIIMLAIPLTAIGIMPGFWMLNVVANGAVGAYADLTLFTATAMIGMIALAGIVVRNSLILVEFVEQARAAGQHVIASLLAAGRMRARPVLLTAGTTLLGNLVITLDPIFSGLAWAIIFGIATSTLFTLLLVPVVYNLVYGESDAAR